MRTALALAGAMFLLGAAPALGATRTVTAASSIEFTPKTVTIQPGDTVSWRNETGLYSGATHNVKFDDGSFEQPPDPDAALGRPRARSPRRAASSTTASSTAGRTARA